MKRSTTIFLQAVTVLIGIGAFVFMLWEPHLEGRNVNATLFEIYLKDSFLAYAYVASIPFFVALYQVFKVFGYAGRGELFSQSAVRALRTIKYSAISLVCFLMGAEVYFSVVQRGKGEDIAGGVMMGFVLILFSVVAATVSAKVLKKVRGIIELMRE